MEEALDLVFVTILSIIITDICYRWRVIDISVMFYHIRLFFSCFKDMMWNINDAKQHYMEYISLFSLLPLFG